MKIVCEQFHPLESNSGHIFLNPHDKVSSGYHRFQGSPLMSNIITREKNPLSYLGTNYDYEGTKIILFNLGFDDKKYVIPLGVAHHPADWTGARKEFIGRHVPHIKHIKPLFEQSVFMALDTHPRPGYNWAPSPKRPIGPYLKDLQEDNAILLLDQTHEGYHVEWLYEWFHAECKKFKISPRNIIYVTGNFLCEEQYTKWADEHLEEHELRMCVIADFGFEKSTWDLLTFDRGGQKPTNFTKSLQELKQDTIVPEKDRLNFEDLSSLFRKKQKDSDYKFTSVIDDPELYRFSDHLGLSVGVPNNEEQYRYKLANINSIKTFNVLQRRSRPHRFFLWKALCDYPELLEDSIHSMSPLQRTIKQDNHIQYYGLSMTHAEMRRINEGLPKVTAWDEGRQKGLMSSSDEDNFTGNLNSHVALNSWFTVVSETFFAEEENCAFISEKTFKAFATHNPFIIYGPRYTLAKLKDLGYKTFPKFIDESYDELNTVDRYNAIVAEMRRLSSLSPQQKLDMTVRMQDIHSHNFENMKKNVSLNWSYSMTKIFKHVKEVFDV